MEIFHLRSLGQWLDRWVKASNICFRSTPTGNISTETKGIYVWKNLLVSSFIVRLYQWKVSKCSSEISDLVDTLKLVLSFPHWKKGLSVQQSIVSRVTAFRLKCSSTWSNATILRKSFKWRTRSKAKNEFSVNRKKTTDQKYLWLYQQSVKHDSASY